MLGCEYVRACGNCNSNSAIADRLALQKRPTVRVEFNHGQVKIARTEEQLSVRDLQLLKERRSIGQAIACQLRLQANQKRAPTPSSTFFTLDLAKDQPIPGPGREARAIAPMMCGSRSALMFDASQVIAATRCWKRACDRFSGETCRAP